MLKHVGTHNNKKVVVLYRQVPGEDHMCLVAYSDALPQHVHNDVMKCLEGAVGQQADNFADALFRVISTDGRNILEVLHKEGFMKKVPTSQVIMTPTASSKVRLDELNSILTEMSKGEDAVKRLAELDASAGLQAKKKDTDPKSTKVESKPLQADSNSVLSDADIANQQLAQAARMKAEAQSLLAEAARLEAEAGRSAPQPTVVAEKRKPGRPPKKVSTVNDTTQKAS